jgi:hypothetical protein
MPQVPDNKEHFASTTSHKTTIEALKDTMSLELAAAYLDCTVDTVRRLVTKGILEAKGKRRVSSISLATYLQVGVRKYGHPRDRHILGSCTTEVLAIDPILHEGQIVNIHCEDIGLTRKIVPYGDRQVVTIDLVGGRGFLMVHMIDGLVVPPGDLLVQAVEEFSTLETGQVLVDTIYPPGFKGVDDGSH